MWYAFWDADQDDDAAFEHRLDSVVREIGERGKLMLPEAVPPFHEPTPAPAPAPKRAPTAATPAPAPAAAAALVPAPAPAPAPRQVPQTPQPSQLDFTPSVQSAPASVVVRQADGPLASSGSAGSFSEMVSFMREEREMMVSAMETQRHEMHALLEQEREQNMKLRETQRAEMDTLREAATKADQVETKARMRDLSLLALQSRLETLHAAKLLADEELYAVEDIIADEDDADGRVAALITLSGKMAGDGAFARQLRRKYA
jgi:hypothetical protein